MGVIRRVETANDDNWFDNSEDWTVYYTEEELKKLQEKGGLLTNIISYEQMEDYLRGGKLPSRPEPRTVKDTRQGPPAPDSNSF